MISKGMCISHGSAVVEYIVRKPSAEMVRLNRLECDDPQEMWNEMCIERLRHPVRNGTLSIIISPTVEESRGWTNDDWQRLLDDYLRLFDETFNGMVINGSVKRDKHGNTVLDADGKPVRHKRRLHSNLRGSQFVCVLHHDSDTPHLHIAINRIDRDGAVNSDNMLGERCALIANKLAQERGYRQAEDVGSDTKAAIARDCRDILARMERFDIERYFTELRRRGYEVKVKKSSDGKVVGYTVALGNSVYKASEIDRQLTAGRLLRTWQGIRFNKSRQQSDPKATTQKANNPRKPRPNDRQDVEERSEISAKPTETVPAIEDSIENAAGVLLDLTSQADMNGGAGTKVNDPKMPRKRKRRGLGM